MPSALTSLRAALGFFTRLPIGSQPLPPSFHGATAWLPAVGLLVGLLVSLVTVLSASVLPPLLSGLLGCLAWVVVTGGLHLDGVADCGDGLTVETTPERRLEIMKDARLGTFGGTALYAVLALKTMTLGHLATQTPATLFTACLLAGLLARSAVFIAMRQPSARPHGLGEALREGTTTQQAACGLGCAFVGCLLSGLPGILALIVTLLFTAGLLRLARQRLGGVTGDIFGCLVESVECLTLLVWCAA